MTGLAMLQTAAVAVDTANAAQASINWSQIREALDTLSNLVIALVAVVALWQLKLAKDALQATRESVEIAGRSVDTAKADMQMRNRREAVILAAEQCRRFGDEIVPKGSDYLFSIYKQGVKSIVWQMRDLEFSTASIGQPRAEVKEWLDAVVQVPDEPMIVLNLLESFAIYFAKGAADEQVAFTATGPVFCDLVERMAPLIIRQRNVAPGAMRSGPFENTIELYRTWSARMKREALEKEAGRLQLDLAATTVPTLKPLGADL